ncbi:aminodeoxychorismate synthase component I [Arsukibacterium sp.]|uniref:aminodeoxychorismate synthase component I n=1 Tax=Arsukibacterium sp. TaxID=1977258 RepID=UPI002FDA2BC2
MQQYLIEQDAPDDLTAIFGFFSDHPWAMLLDSAASAHPNSRYHIMVLQPQATLRAQAGVVTLSDEHGQHHYTEDPFTVLDCALKRYFPTPLSSDLPFSGGALGYFGYDLGRYTERLPALCAQDIKLPDMAIGLYRWALVLDSQSKQLWCVDYDGQAEQRWQRLRQLMAKPLVQINFSLTGPWQANMSQAQYAERFAQIQQHLHAGNCYQINLAQRFAAPYQGNEWHAYLQLRKANAAPFSAFMRLPEGAILSISPERFLQLKQQEVETKPIKGTRPRHRDPEQDQLAAMQLQQAEKDRAENVMIVDLLRNDLGKVCQSGSVKVPQLFAIESFPAVHHLVSTVTGTLAAHYSAADLLRGAFPGGSITGAPKIAAMQIIEQLEPHCRSVYCGAIGYINNNGDMDTNIAIRTLVCNDAQIYCWAGGGIVADSEVNSEYQETLDKVHKILPLLATMAAEHSE